VPQDRAGRCSTELFERYQRSEKALGAALAEISVQRVSTRQVKAITAELCGHSFSASAISAKHEARRGARAFCAAPARRGLPVSDRRCALRARARGGRDPAAPAVLRALGIGWDRRRSIVAVEMHETWLEAHRDLSLDDPRERQKETLRMAA
jgi:transposase-like protein